ncbi:MAG: hydrogenase maturation protease [Gammaproteobacteria bacterium]|nr:hydrogenase maturation protease [Gammaproteobacteria bacterium]
MSLSIEPAAAPVLLIGIGNPSRGDDAIGPFAIERLEGLDLPDTELFTDFQLQVEHALDLVGRDEVIFIDAAVSGPEPFSFAPVTPAADASTSTHALSPAAVLDALQRVTEARQPAAYVLAIRGYGFELGAPLSEKAGENLEDALRMLISRLTSGSGQLQS